MGQRRKFTGIIESHQVPLLEYVYFEHSADPVWRVWLNYDQKRECGTYLRLHTDGSIVRETRLASGEVVRVGTVKPGEG